MGNVGVALELVLEAESEEDHDEGGDHLANALHGKDGTHHGTTPLLAGKPATR